MNSKTTETRGDDGRADTLFAAFLERYHAGEGSLEELCTSHPEHAEDFARLWRHLCAIGEIDSCPPPAEPADDGSLDDGSLDEFRLVREIGRGGMGVVYEAEDRVLHRRVAVKVLSGARRLMGDGARRFEREITALSRLAHPHIVPVHRSGLERDPPYLVMELVRGARSLGEVLEDLKGVSPAAFRPGDLLHPGELPGAESTTTTRGTATRPGDRSYCGALARLMAEVAEALEHAHQNGVLHRDVKPGNILVDERGSARLVDFGVARVRGEESLTITGGFAGTPVYAAPEQISSDFGTVDGRADVYALGVVLYELLTGQRPYSGGEAREVFGRILSENPREPRQVASGVPWELSVICAKAMEKRPELRYPSALAMAADLRAFLAHRPIVARPPTWGRRLRRSMQRHPLASGALAFVAALLLCVAGFAMASSFVEAARERAVAETALADAPRVGAELGAYYRRIAACQDALRNLRARAYARPVGPLTRWLMEVLDRSIQSDRVDASQLLFKTSHLLLASQHALGREPVRAAQQAILQPALRFARDSEDRGFENTIRDILVSLDCEVLPRRGSFAVHCEPADAEVYLFRYVEERALAGGRWTRRLFPVPCSGAGEVLGFPADVAWCPGEIYRCAGADRASAYPLFADARNHLETPAELPAELPEGSYLLLFRRAGHDDLRLPLNVDSRRRPEYWLCMDPAGHAPPGFVKVVAGEYFSGGDRGRSYQSQPRAWRAIRSFYIGRHEVRFGEYLEVMRWKAERGGRVRQHLPRNHRGELQEPWTIDFRSLAIEPPAIAELPVCSIRFADALAYCAFRNERAELAGEPWIYELPWAMSWEKAARGADGRFYSWGDEFDWQLCFGKMTEAHTAVGLPWMPVITSAYPGDESPYGVLGLTGNVEEFVYREDRISPLQSQSIKGGGFTRPDPMSYRLPRHVSFIPEPSRGTGFRLVARHRDMPPQGPLGDPARGPTTESIDD